VSETVRAPITLEGQNDILRARSAGRDVARSLGFSTADQTRLATAISELSRNALNYGLGGVCTISVSRDGEGRHTIRVVVEDHGPGIADIVLALQPGFSSGGGLGQGLSAVRRLMDELEVDSVPGRTTIVTKMSRGP
jgi:serine/threonine-protein kinase RsbT